VPTELDNARHYALALRPGTELDGIYRITRVLGQASAFAVTYLAQDERANDRVVIKEFLPRTLAGRASDQLTVRAHSSDDAIALSRALRRFAREAELLTDIAHPNIPRVRRHFEANGTAYMVQQYYEGKTLAEHAAAAGGRLLLDGAVGLVLQILQGLEALHSEGIVHGYVTPDSVLVDDNSRALILGLGTTRHVVGAAKEPTSGYAPIEQYASKEVGPWTDVYASAAVLYRLVTGTAPPSAVERSAGQSIPLSWAASANVPPALARTVIAALAQLPDTRPHSAEEFRRRLDSSLALGAQTTAARPEPRSQPTRWPSPDLADPPFGPPQPTPVPDTQELPASVDEAPYSPLESPPNDRMRRLLRLVLGGGAAAASILLTVSIVRGRSDNAWLSAGVASPTGVAGAQVPAAGRARIESGSSFRSTGMAGGSFERTPLKPAGDKATSGAARVASKPEPTPATRSRETAPRAVVQSGSSGPAPEQRPAPSVQVGAPPSINLSVPATLGRVELPPTEVIAGLREQLAHGNENVELGEYANAGRIFGSALAEITKLSDRYTGVQAFAVLRREFEQAAQRAAASCRAENEVIRKRNGRPLRCE
jgi:serine/threonine protein kinase